MDKIVGLLEGSLEISYKVFIFNTKPKAKELKRKVSHGQAFTNYPEILCPKLE